MTEAYITGVGAYLPGDPVGNTELAARFGHGSPRGAARRRRALAANGIRTRHYAVDDQGMTVMLNEELAAHAARRALRDRGLPVSAVRMLATGTTAGDVLVPGFAPMVHGRLGGGPMELLSAAGVCASGMAALKAAVSAVRLGEHPVAVAVGSELVSRSFAAPGVPDDPACPTSRSPPGSRCLTAPSRTTCRTRSASCTCITGSNWSGTPLSTAWRVNPGKAPARGQPAGGVACRLQRCFSAVQELPASIPSHANHPRITRSAMARWSAGQPRRRPDSARRRGLLVRR
jgi:hypothetical protein